MSMVYVLLGTGFEEIEAIAPLDLLRRAGVSVLTVGLNGKTVYGGHNIGFEADITMIPRINISLRFAERVYIKLGSFEVHSFDDLFEGTKNIPWETFIGKNDAFPVKGYSINSQKKYF